MCGCHTNCSADIGHSAQFSSFIFDACTLLNEIAPSICTKQRHLADSMVTQCLRCSFIYGIQQFSEIVFRVCDEKMCKVVRKKGCTDELFM